MKQRNYFKGIKIWLISLFSFDLLLLFYLFLFGRILEMELLLPNLIQVTSMIIAFLSVIVGIAAFIYSIVKKQYEYIVHAVGILFCSLLLFLGTLIIALSTIY